MKIEINCSLAPLNSVLHSSKTNINKPSNNTIKTFVLDKKKRTPSVDEINILKILNPPIKI